MIDRRGAMLALAGAGLVTLDQRRRAAVRELRRHELYTAVTGLPNRQLLTARLDVALARARRHGLTVALLCVDLDRFALVNDSLGLAGGDRLLAEVGQRLVDCAREEDTVAHLGADQFAILLEQVADPTGAVRVARRIHRVLERPFLLGRHTVSISAGIGIAASERGEVGAPELLRGATLALGRAKQHGRGRDELFEPAMAEEASRRLATEQALRMAVEQHQFSLHYQPEVRLEDNEILGLEALVRWEHPELGTISADEFIPMAEDTGLIVPLGEWVLEEACNAAQRFQRLCSIPLRMSVNVSGRQLEHAHEFVAIVAAVIERTGADPALLVLEITESVLMADPVEAATTLRALSDLGVGIAIDDFGAGYSSLIYLKHFPFAILKLDRSLAAGLETATDRAIVAAVIQLAAALGATVTVEGIEDSVQLGLLRQLGCHVGQGYWFSRPVPEADAAVLVRQGSFAPHLSLPARSAAAPPPNPEAATG